MNLFQTHLTGPGHLNEALVHFNEAVDASKSGRPGVHVSQALFNSLNKIQTEWVLHRLADLNYGDTKAFQEMTLALSSDARAQMVGSPELQSLVAFRPRVMNHDTLRRRGYRPRAIEPALVRDATECHEKLERAFDSLDFEETIEVQNRVLKRAAELLYIVRSNLAHGEKTAYGPDLAKRERDEEVCNVVVPLQNLLIDLLLDGPSMKLVAYGTLAPDMPNHSLIEDLSGSWERCQVNGTLTYLDGLSRLAWDPDGALIDSMLLVSRKLPGAWQRIDEFEGPAYRRRLITLHRSSGISVANVYLDAVQT